MAARQQRVGSRGGQMCTVGNEEGREGGRMRIEYHRREGRADGVIQKMPPVCRTCSCRVCHSPNHDITSKLCGFTRSLS